MKEGVIERLQVINKKPLSDRRNRIVNAYFDHLKMAEANDIVIDNEINDFISGAIKTDPRAKEDEINDMIEQSMEFYNALEMKLDELEKML